MDIIFFIYFQEDISAIFEAADEDKSGFLTVGELRDVIDDIIMRYPQLGLYLTSKHLADVTDLLKDSEGNERKEVDIEGFRLALSHVDSQMKSLPATAQVLCLSSFACGKFAHAISFSCHI